MKIYDILELQRLDLVDLSFTADDFGVDFRGKAKQQLIYLSNEFSCLIEIDF